MLKNEEFELSLLDYYYNKYNRAPLAYYSAGREILFKYTLHSSTQEHHNSYSTLYTVTSNHGLHPEDVEDLGTLGWALKDVIDNFHNLEYTWVYEFIQ